MIKTLSRVIRNQMRRRGHMGNPGSEDSSAGAVQSHKFRLRQGDPAMKRTTSSGGTALAIVALVGAFGLSGAYADQHVYEPPKAEQQYLAKHGLAGVAGQEAHVRHVAYPPGWVGGKHSHLGDVYVYVLEGSMVFDVEGKEPVTVGPGGLFHEQPNSVMRAANASKTDRLRIVLFQVNPTGQPLMIKAE